MDPRVNQLVLEALCKINETIGQSLNLDQTLELVLEILAELLSMKRATITLKHEQEDILSIRASHGLGPEQKKGGVYRLDEGVTGLIFRTAEPLVAPDVTKEPLFLNKTDSRKIEKRQVSFIGVPIILHGTPVGVLSVDRLFDEDVPFEADIKFLTILAALVAQLVSLNRQVKTREENLIKANSSLKADLSERSEGFFSVGLSPAILEVQDLIRSVAPTEATVLILGEPGTGKTLVAQIIHELSGRARFSFIRVNCAALSNHLLESELFGYETGEPPDSTESKIGRLEAADGGSVFLDEIGEVTLTLQVKILQFLQYREFEPVGGSKTRSVDVRVIAATNRDLRRSVADGSFREDLYYRLNVFPIRLPSLRERREDISPLINFFSDKIGRDYKCELKFTDAALDALLKYSWPGNVREVENLIERLAITLCGEIIDVGDLLPYFTRNRRGLETRLWQQLGSLREREKRDVVAALARNNWILSHAAQELGITRRQMGYKVKQFGLEDVVKQQKLRAHTASNHQD